jgi:hypothetical protein
VDREPDVVQMVQAGKLGAAFDDDLAAAIGPFAAADGTVRHDVSFVYDLARKPTDETIPHA